MALVDLGQLSADSPYVHALIGLQAHPPTFQNKLFDAASSPDFRHAFDGFLHGCFNATRPLFRTDRSNKDQSNPDIWRLQHDAAALLIEVRATVPRTEKGNLFPHRSGEGC